MEVFVECMKCSLCMERSMLEREDTRTIRNLQRAVIWSAVWRYLSRHECSKMTACVCGRARGHRKRCPLMTYYKVGVAIDTGANLKKAEGQLNPPIPRATAKRDQALTEAIYRSGKLHAFDCGLMHLLKWPQHRRVGKMLSEIAEWAGIDPERVQGYECGRRPVCGGMYSSSEARALLLRAMNNVPPELAVAVLVVFLAERVSPGMLRNWDRGNADE